MQLKLVAKSAIAGSGGDVAAGVGVGLGSCVPGYKAQGGQILIRREHMGCPKFGVRMR
jgi:hypothetical protein